MVEVMTQHQSEQKISYQPCLPEVVRVMTFSFEMYSQGWAEHLAHVYGDSDEMYLAWQRPFPEQRIQEGCLARVYWPTHLNIKDGVIDVVRLAPLEEPDGTVNLFETIPDEWLRNREIIDRATALIDQLPPAMRLIWNRLMWWPSDLRHYVTAPATLDDHHNGWGGNLRHAVEVAEHAERIALEVPGVSTAFLILAGMLHQLVDVVPFVWNDGRWSQSAFHVWQARRKQLQAFITTILDGHPDALSARERQLLMQIMFAEAGIRQRSDKGGKPALELEILSLADRLSAATNLSNQGGVH